MTNILKCSLIAAAVIGMQAAPASAQFPDRAIQLVVPFNPGGGSDRIARAVDGYAQEEFGAPFSFDYKPGAGGHIGMSGVARAADDGYVIATFNSPDIAIGPLTGAAQYRLDDFTYLAQMAADPVLMMAETSKGISSVGDLIAKAEAEPGRLSLAVAGAKGGTHLAALQFLQRTGLDMNVVVFPGGAELAAAVLGGQVDVGMSGIAPFLGSLDAVEMIASLSEERHSRLPDTPTLTESGIDLTASVGRIFVAPTIDDPAVVERLRDGLRRIYDQPEFQQEMRSIGQEPDWIPGEEVKATLETYQKDAEQTISQSGL